MSKSLVLGTILVGVIACLIVLSYLSARQPRLAVQFPSDDITVERLHPKASKMDEVTCQSGGLVNYCFAVENLTSRRIRQLKLDLACGCEAIDRIPTELDPGGKAVVCFRIRAPRVGMLKRDIYLFGAGSAKPIATFPIRIRVVTQPPLMIAEGEPLEMTFVAGDKRPRELPFTTIERRGTEMWIEALTCAPHDIVDVDSVQIDEFREPDPDLVRRVYRFRIRPTTVKRGRETALISLTTRNGAKEIANPFHFTINVLDQVTIVPNPLALSIEHRTKGGRAIVLFRGVKGTVQIENYDGSLLDIRRESYSDGKAAAFRVTPVIADMREDRETSVIFRFSDGQTRKLRVVLKASKI